MENIQKSNLKTSASEESFAKFDLNESRLFSHSVCESDASNKTNVSVAHNGKSTVNSSNQCLGSNQLIHGLMNFEQNIEDLEFNDEYDELCGEKDVLDSEESCPGSTNADSEDDYESHFDAIDELAGILSDSSEEQTRNAMSSGSPFERPSNPVCNDRQFYLPRCSAPAPVVSQMNIEGENMKSVYSTYSSAPSSYEAATPMSQYINMSAHGVFSNRPSSLSY